MQSYIHLDANIFEIRFYYYHYLFQKYMYVYLEKILLLGWDI